MLQWLLNLFCWCFNKSVFFCVSLGITIGFRSYLDHISHVYQPFQYYDIYSYSLSCKYSKRSELFKFNFLYQKRWNCIDAMLHEIFLACLNLPVIISWSQVIEMIAWLLIPETPNANAWGYSHSSPVPVGPLNMRLSGPPPEPDAAFPRWKRNGVPWPSGVLGCHLCCATWAAGAFESTTTIISEDAWIAAAGRLQYSGDGTTYGLTTFGLRNIVLTCKEIYTLSS